MRWLSYWWVTFKQTQYDVSVIAWSISTWKSHVHYIHSSFTTQPLFTLTTIFFQLHTLIHPKAPLQALLQGEKCQILQQLKTQLVHQLQPSIITSINHCHLAPHQPHASLSAAPSACSPQECWVMSDGKGHPGIWLRAMLGRKERCVVRVCELVYIYICGM